MRCDLEFDTSAKTMLEYRQEAYCSLEITQAVVPKALPLSAPYISHLQERVDHVRSHGVDGGDSCLEEATQRHNLALNMSNQLGRPNENSLDLFL